MTVLSGARRWGRSWQSRGAAIVAVLGALACSATLGDRMGAARSAICGGRRARGWWRAGSSPARAGWWPRAAVPKRGNRRCRQPSGTGTAGHESARSSRLGQRYGRLMNDSSRPPLPVSATALLRYSVVAEVEDAGAARVARGSCGTPRCRRRPGRPGRSPGAHPACVPCNAGARPGRAASSPPWSRGSAPATSSQALSVELVAFLRTEKRCDPRASAPELVRRARERGIVPVDLKIDRTSVWRACRRKGLPTRQRPHKREGDTRRWQYAERMQCVLADGKHFRAERGASAPSGAVLPRRCHALRPAGAGGHRGVQRAVPARPLPDGHAARLG